MKCNARLNVTYNLSNTIFIEYYWKHEHYDPADISDSRITDDVCAWVEEHVERHTDWRGIKTLLHMDNDELDKVYMTIFTLPSYLH